MIKMLCTPSQQTSKRSSVMSYIGSNVHERTGQKETSPEKQRHNTAMPKLVPCTNAATKMDQVQGSHISKRASQVGFKNLM